MITLTRRARFSAGHRYHSSRLSPDENTRVFGKCNYPYGHGHNYTVEVTVAGPVDPITGMIVDLAWLDELIHREIVEPFDHRFLNHEVVAFAEVVPTTENIAAEVWRRLASAIEAAPRCRLVRVRVREDEDLYAECDGT